ncbi:hypothetical protein SMICM17S_04562 [Streptomyces microflavus]
MLYSAPATRPWTGPGIARTQVIVPKRLELVRRCARRRRRGDASRSALNELRVTVGLLRGSGDPEAPTEPAPGLAVLDELVTTFRNAGLPVEVASGPGARSSAAVDLATSTGSSEEALTNVRKHAGAGARAEVSVVRVGVTAEITVLDNGRGSAARRAGDGGAAAATGNGSGAGAPDGGGRRVFSACANG